MAKDDSEKDPSLESAETEGLAPSTAAHLSKAKSHEIPDIFQAIQVLKIEDLADPRVISMLVQILNEKIDRIRVLEAEGNRVKSERESLAILCARQEEKLTVSKKSHALWAGVGILGGILSASSISALGNKPVFVILLVSGILLSCLGAVGAKA